MSMCVPLSLSKTDPSMLSAVRLVSFKHRQEPKTHSAHLKCSGETAISQTFFIIYRWIYLAPIQTIE